MGIVVRVPVPLRQLVGGQREAVVSASSIAELIDRLDEAYPGMKSRLCDTAGGLLPFVNLYVSGEDIRHREGLATVLRDGEVVVIVPAVSGGRVQPLETR